MIFKRKFTPAETKIIGKNPTSKIHDIIDAALNRMKNTRDTHTIEARILSLLSETKPMNAREITEAHNALYGKDSISLNYIRFVLSGMFNIGLVKRKQRGKYVK